MRKSGYCFRLFGFQRCLLLAMLGITVLVGPGALAQDRPADIFDALQVIRLPEPPLAPTFTLSDVDGNQHTLEDYRGKLVFLNFWTTW